MNVKFMVTPENRKAHEALVNALGTENNITQWIEFMDCVDKYIPELSTKGRPNKKQIENSLIGRLGFSSWKEMINAPIENNGLGWSNDGWNSWRRAWAVVKKYPYLRNEKLKSGWINKIYSDIKKEGKEFPITKREFDEYKIKREEENSSSRKNKVEELEKNISELNSQINKFKTLAIENKRQLTINLEKLSKADQYNEALISSLENSQLERGKLEAECNQVKTEIEAQKKAYRQLEKKKQIVPKPSWFESLKRVFLLD